MIQHKKVKAIESCENAIDIVLEECEQEIIAQVGDPEGYDLTIKEREIANHIVSLWNEHIDSIDNINDNDMNYIIEQEAASRPIDEYNPDE